MNHVPVEHKILFGDKFLAPYLRYFVNTGHFYGKVISDYAAITSGMSLGS